MTFEETGFTLDWAISKDDSWQINIDPLFGKIVCAECATTFYNTKVGVGLFCLGLGCRWDCFCLGVGFIGECLGLGQRKWGAGVTDKGFRVYGLGGRRVVDQHRPPLRRDSLC